MAPGKILQVLVDITEVAFFSDKTIGGEKRFDDIGKQTTFFDLGERNPLEANLLFVMFGSGTKTLNGLKRAMKDAFNLVEIGMTGAKGVVFSDVFTNVGKFADFNRDADFLLCFPCEGLMEGFAVLLTTAGKDIEDPAGVAHFDGKEFAIFDDEGSCGSSYMGHGMSNGLKWERHKTQAFEIVR